MSGYVDLSRLRVGEVWLVDGRRYARCATCRKVVRVDKPILGDLHLCA